MKVYIGPYPENGSEEERNIDIVIDKHDTWSMDNTLAHIIIPMLKQLKNTKHGIPSTIIPEGLNGKYSNEEFAEWQTRWDEILDKMIWSFEQIVRSDDYEFELYQKNETVLREYEDRIQEGLALFGKHYRDLWD